MIHFCVSGGGLAGLGPSTNTPVVKVSVKETVVSLSLSVRGAPGWSIIYRSTGGTGREQKGKTKEDRSRSNSTRKRIRERERRRRRRSCVQVTVNLEVCGCGSRAAVFGREDSEKLLDSEKVSANVY